MKQTFVKITEKIQRIPFLKKILYTVAALVEVKDAVVSASMTHFRLKKNDFKFSSMILKKIFKNISPLIITGSENVKYEPAVEPGRASKFRIYAKRLFVYF